MSKTLSIIIPTRNDKFLQTTVDDILDKARGEIEIIAVYDGIKPTTVLKGGSRVRAISHGELHDNPGMRESINLGVSISNGDHIMKCDDHCAFDEGFDIKVLADIKDNWVVIPRLYKMSYDGWDRRTNEHYIDNFHLGWLPEFDQICGRVWGPWRRKRDHIKIDDCMIFGGPCYIMSRKHWDWLGGLDSDTYGKRSYEAREIGLKTWLGGGRVVRNKNTWFAHRTRRKGDGGRGFRFTREQEKDETANKEKNRLFFLNYWLMDKWPDRVHDFEWFIEKFHNTMPMPGWPKNWKEELYKFKEQLHEE